MRVLLRLVLIWVVGCIVASASPAPAPALQSPASGATNVDPDPALTWRWVDELVSNGSFESGMAPGWYTGGTYPDTWQVLADTTNRYGMGYRLATTYRPAVSRSTGQTPTGVRLSFPTHTSRYYTVEQSDTLVSGGHWYDVLAGGAGSGTPMEVEVPLPSGDKAFWRLRVDP